MLHSQEMNAQSRELNDSIIRVQGRETEARIFYSNKVLKEIIRTKDGKKHGMQELYYNNGVIHIKSNYQNGNLSGEYIEFDYQGNTIEKKFYKFDKKKKLSVLDGKYERYENKILSKSIKYKDGLINGKYLEYNGGKLKTQAFYKDDMLIGEKLDYNYNTGKLMSIQHHKIIEEKDQRKSVLDGSASYFDYSGSLQSTGEFHRGLKEGIWKTFYQNSTKLESEITYKNGKQHGSYLYYYITGTLKKCGVLYQEIELNGKIQNYVNDGQLEEYFQNGRLERVSEYDMGKKTGKWLSYYENGGLRESSEYHNNLQFGLYEYYNQDCSKLVESYFKIIKKDSIEVSVKHGVERRWEGGVVVSKQNFVDGLEQGTRLSFYKSGKLASEIEIFDGNLNGKYLEYYENGKPKSIKNYRTFYQYNSKKTEWVGWRYDYDNEGDFSAKYYADTTGKILVSILLNKGLMRQFSCDNLFAISYFPNGKLMSIEVFDYYRQAAFSQYFFLSGKTRKIAFQNPQNFVTNYIDYSSDGEIMCTYSEQYQNPDSLKPSNEIAKKYSMAIGLNFIPNKFYEDLVKDGIYKLQYANGKPFAEMEFQNDIPNGKFIFYDALSGDTLWFKNLSEGLQKGFFKEKFAGQVLIHTGESYPFNRNGWIENYKSNGTPVNKYWYDEKGDRVIAIEYYENGRLKSESNTLKGISTDFDQEGRIYNQNIKIGEWANYRNYYPETGRLKSQNFYRNGKQDSLYETFFASGQIQYSYYYKQGKRNGTFTQYDENGKIKLKGEFINDLQEGEWLKYEENKEEKLIFIQGKLKVKPPTAPCACIDTAESSGRIGFANSLQYMVEYQTFKNYLPNFIKPIDSLNYNSIFLTGLQNSSNYSSSFVSMNLIMFKPFALNIPADEQLKITFNPCRTNGYLSRMEVSVNYDTKSANNTSATLSPKRISIEFLKGPLKSADPNYSNFIAFFETNDIEFNAQNKFEIQLDNKVPPCFISGIIRNFLSIETKAALPLIFKSPDYSELKLSDSERENFFGLMINSANVSFNYLSNNKMYKISGTSNNILAGGKFVSGQISIPCKKIGLDTYQIVQGRNVLQISSQAIKMEWLKNGFTRLSIDFNEKEEILILQFFAE